MLNLSESDLKSIDLKKLRLYLESMLQLSSDDVQLSDFNCTNFVLLGSGSLYSQTFISNAINKLNVVEVVDNFKVGQKINNILVSGDSAIVDIGKKYTNVIGVLCCQSDEATNHFKRMWSQTGRPLLNIFEVMRASCFDKTEEYYSNFTNRLEIASIYDKCSAHFVDPHSLRTFLCLLLYRVTLSQNWLEAIRLPYEDMYFFTSGLTLAENEIYVDAGSFDGDSILHFLRSVHGKYRHIHAFEPDPLNFKLMSNNLRDLHKCSLYSYGLWSYEMDTNFQFEGLGSRIDVNGLGQPVKLAALDHLNLGEVTLIKMDIEGAEVQALEGAADTLRRFKPKLAIAAYHKSDDLLVLIDTINSIRGDYRFTLRHHSPFFRDTVLMAY